MFHSLSYLRIHQCWGVVVLIFSFLMVSCESATHIDIDAEIEQKVQERLDEYRRVMDERCLERALEEAGRQADSIVLTIARGQKDTLSKPFKPLRPDRPELLELKDSLDLAPLFDSTRQQ